MTAKQSILKSRTIVARKRKKHLRFALFSFAVLAIIVLLPILVVRIPAFAIRTVNIVGAKTTDSNAIKDSVIQTLSGSFLKIFPRATFLTLGKKDIAQKISRDFLAVQNISLSLHVPNILTVLITEREPFALWCNSDCYFLDKEGFIYDKAPEFSSPVYIIFRRDITSEPLGNRVGDKESFARVNNLVRGFAVFGLKTKEIVFNENGAADFNLPHGALFVSLRQSDELTLNNLGSLLGDPKKKLTDGNGGLTVSYIDLRFGNKIFYK